MIEIIKNNHTVRISVSHGEFYSVHAVNTRKGWFHPDMIVLSGKTHFSEKSARKWAERRLADA